MSVKPQRLRPHATIAVIAPASPVRSWDKLERGIRYLESLGYSVVVGDSVNHADGYLAGSDQLRAREIERFFADPTVAAIFCARGGYGTMRLLELLDWDLIRRHPKLFVGFSDVTALQWALLARAGMPSLSGLMVGVDFDRPDPAYEALFWSLLTEPRAETLLWQGTPDDVLLTGYAEGPLLAGTLTLIAALCGTPYLPPLDNCILLLEDIGEHSYRLDRMLCQLMLSGVLQQCSGLAFGTFIPPSSEPPSTPERPLRQIFVEYIERARPSAAVMNLPYGHIPTKISVPVGLRARLDAERQQLVLLEPLVC